jgi:hypothetical protein
MNATPVQSQPFDDVGRTGRDRERRTICLRERRNLHDVWNCATQPHECPGSATAEGLGMFLADAEHADGERVVHHCDTPEPLTHSREVIERRRLTAVSAPSIAHENRTPTGSLRKLRDRVRAVVYGVLDRNALDERRDGGPSTEGIYGAIEDDHRIRACENVDDVPKSVQRRAMEHSRLGLLTRGEAARQRSCCRGLIQRRRPARRETRPRRKTGR